LIACATGGRVKAGADHHVGKLSWRDRAVARIGKIAWDALGRGYDQR